MKSFLEHWSSVDAALFIFIWQEEDDPSREWIVEHEQMVRDAFNRFDRDTDTPASNVSIRLDAIVRAMKSAVPNISDTFMQHPVVWASWAIHSTMLPLSPSFIERLGAWRADVGRRCLPLMLYRREKNGKVTWIGRKWTPKGMEELRGYTLDELLLGKELNVGKNILKLEWKMKCPEWPLQICKDTAAATQSDSMDKRLQPVNCPAVNGPGARSALRNAIVKFAVLKEIQKMDIFGAMSGDRITCHISRSNLVTLLRKSDKDLRKYKPATLIRVLPEIAQCPRGRPGGVREVKL